MVKKRRKPASARRDETIRVRVTEDERRALQQAAEQAHLELSAWLRQALLKAAGV